MANIEPNNQQSISDDQELAKVLAGVTQQADDASAAGVGTTFDTSAVDTTDAAATTDDTAAPAVDDATDSAQPVTSMPQPDPVPAAIEEPIIQPVSDAAPTRELDSVKQQALSELRPLVDKLDVSPEEKFDTYLLLLRSTDDRDLIAPAHEAAKSIADEGRRAQALLDIIKEIDFLSQNQAS